MKTLLIIFTLLFFAPSVEAQNVGFFIPQDTLNMMNRPEQLPPIRTQRQTANNPQANNQTPGRTVPATANTRTNNPNVATPKNSRIPPQTVASTPTSRPETSSNSTPSQKTLAADTARRKAAPEPRPADEPMVPQTGTPAIPVTADDIAVGNTPADNIRTTPPSNSPTQPTEAPVAPVNTDKIPSANVPNAESTQPLEPQAYARIIEEYKEDIKKISRNIPVENKRLNEMLQNYKDEVLILN